MLVEFSRNKGERFPHAIEHDISLIFPHFKILRTLANNQSLDYDIYLEIQSGKSILAHSAIDALKQNGLLNITTMKDILSHDDTIQYAKSLTNGMRINAIKIIIDDFEYYNTNTITRHLNDDYDIYHQLKKFYDALPDKTADKNRPLSEEEFAKVTVMLFSYDLNLQHHSGGRYYGKMYVQGTPYTTISHTSNHIQKLLETYPNPFLFKALKKYDLLNEENVKFIYHSKNSISSDSLDKMHVNGVLNQTSFHDVITSKKSRETSEEMDKR